MKAAGLKALVVAAAGAWMLGCGAGTAPACRSDADCADGRRCEPAAGVCVGFDSPLLPAPDGGADAAAEDAAAEDAAADDAAAADAADAEPPADAGLTD